MSKLRKKPRSYSDFTLNDLREMFDIKNERKPFLLAQKKIKPSEWLKTTLLLSNRVPLNSEKAFSELLVTPILLEWLNNNPKKIQYFSGNTFDVLPEKSLKGRCDFLFTKTLSLDIVAPIIAMFEAKDDNVDHWYGQCGAEMYAAKLFNEQQNEPYKIIYGCVTNGREWVFLRLEENTLFIDTDRYYLNNLDELIGALQTVIDFYD
jgi:hypothetical protein